MVSNLKIKDLTPSKNTTVSLKKPSSIAEIQANAATLKGSQRGEELAHLYEIKNILGQKQPKFGANPDLYSPQESSIQQETPKVQQNDQPAQNIGGTIKNIVDLFKTYHDVDIAGKPTASMQAFKMGGEAGHLLGTELSAKERQDEQIRQQRQYEIDRLLGERAYSEEQKEKERTWLEEQKIKERENEKEKQKQDHEFEIQKLLKSYEEKAKENALTREDKARIDIEKLEEQKRYHDMMGNWKESELTNKKILSTIAQANKDIVFGQKKDQRIADRMTKLNEAIDTTKAGARSALGVSQLVYDRGTRLSGLFDAIEKYQAGNPDKRQMEEIAIGLNSLIQGGNQGAQKQVEALVPKTGMGRVADITEWLSNKPYGTKQKEFLDRYLLTIKREHEIAAEQLKSAQYRRIAPYMDVKEGDLEGFNDILRSNGIDPVEYEAWKKGGYKNIKETKEEKSTDIKAISKDSKNKLVKLSNNEVISFDEASKRGIKWQ